MHENELKSLQEQVKKARGSLGRSPNDEVREARERELKNLELAWKRAESAVNRDKKVTIDQEALLKVRKEEQEKRKKGKNAWWMKECEWYLWILFV